MSIFFILRHRTTGLVMPAQMSRSGRGGYSFWEPSSKNSYDHGYGTVPRLFETLRGAQNARSAWAQGFHKRECGTSYDWEGTPDGYDNHIITDAGRKLEELEIIKVSLHLPRE